MILGCLLGAVLFHGQSGSSINRPQFYGDHRTVLALAFTADGNLVAATKGGIVTFGADLRSRSYGLDGLIDNRGPDDVWLRDGKVLASAGDRVAQWDGARLILDATVKSRIPQTLTFDGHYVVPDRPAWPIELTGSFAAPKGDRGAFVSAVAGDANSFVVAWHGDGLWTNAGGAWKRLPGPSFPQVRSLAARGADLALATFAGEVWLRRAGRWKELKLDNEPHGSVYLLALYRGSVFAGTFENGIARFDGKHWTEFPTPPHPRDMVIFQNNLYVRETTGQVDRFDGRTWVRNVFPWLPRPEVSCLGIGDGKLLIGAYGGWSEFDGTKWAHFLKLPELEGYEVTALAGRAGEVWAGTQERGVFVFDRKTSHMVNFDQRQGLGDDWIRRILLDGQDAVLGLFRSGAFIRQGDIFTRLTPQLTNEATGLAVSPSGKIFVGSREGLWRIDAGAALRIGISGPGPLEIQTLMASPGGLWVGTPNGVAFLPWSYVST